MGDLSLLIVVIVGAMSVVGAWWFKDWLVRREIRALNEQINTLNEQIETLQQRLRLVKIDR